MHNALLLETTGGPDVFQWSSVDTPDPASGEILLRHTAIGLNFIDVYHRTGLYPMALPGSVGIEGVGVVEALGDGVTDLSVGDRVGYALAKPGGYSEMRTIAADRTVRLPDAIGDEEAAALLTKGCTAEFLIHRIYAVKPGDKVLLHAAAGGVGLIMSQWLAAKGAIILATAGGPEKVKLANSHGCNLVVDYTAEDFIEAVRDFTEGKGVPVVYDSVGAATFDGSLDCLAPRGTMVTFGNATGPVPPLAPARLAQGGQSGGSLFLTRPSLKDYIADRADLVQATRRVFDAVAAGHITPTIGQRYALKDAATAHRDLEARKTTGQSVILP